MSVMNDRPLRWKPLNSWTGICREKVKSILSRSVVGPTRPFRPEAPVYLITKRSLAALQGCSETVWGAYRFRGTSCVSGTEINALN